MKIFLSNTLNKTLESEKPDNLRLEENLLKVKIEVFPVNKKLCKILERIRFH